jgi:hypothetical protein
VSVKKQTRPTPVNDAGQFCSTPREALQPRAFSDRFGCAAFDQPHTLYVGERAARLNIVTRSSHLSGPLATPYDAPMNLTRFLAAATLLLALTGCSTFDRDYKQALASGVPANSIEGPWEGRWTSQGGHGGDRLRAIVTRTAPDTYHARFRAQYWGILSGDEDVDLHVTSAAPVRANGEADLGFWKGGVYRYDATITPGNFDATYKSKDDHGEFNLTRPPR